VVSRGTDVISCLNNRILILGGGISGLSVAWLLKQRGILSTVVEAQNQIGGLARSFNWHGIDCDIAPHRLFTHNQEVLELIRRLVPMHQHRRKSCIFIQGKTIKDPIDPVELCLSFPNKAPKLIGGFLFKPKLEETSFANLALNRYGQGLYNLFFEPYTQKLLGVSAKEISPEWGRQKLRSSGFGQWFKRNSKTYFNSFYYPITGGYGTIAKRMAEELGDNILVNTRVSGLNFDEKRITSATLYHNGKKDVIECDNLISTLPATTLATMLGQNIDFQYNPISLVYLNINKSQVMPYHWAYFADESIVINRMAEFKNFSQPSVATDNTVLCAEVTAHSDTPSEDVVSALVSYGLIKRHEIEDVLVLEESYGYPIYLKGFETERTEALEIFGQYRNLYTVGRNAEFRHIDVDEDIESAISCVENIIVDLGIRRVKQET
jgi:protoporphyrinogen oxidase